MPKSSEFISRNCYDLTATIATSGDTSEAVDLGGCSLAGAILPSTFDGTAFTLQVSDTLDGVYFDALDNGGNAIGASSNAIGATSIAASRFVSLDTSKTQGMRFIKIKAGSTQTTTDTIIKLVTRSL